MNPALMLIEFIALVFIIGLVFTQNQKPPKG